VRLPSYFIVENNKEGEKSLHIIRQKRGGEEKSPFAKGESKREGKSSGEKKNTGSVVKSKKEKEGGGELFASAVMGDEKRFLDPGK